MTAKGQEAYRIKAEFRDTKKRLDHAIRAIEVKGHLIRNRTLLEMAADIVAVAAMELEDVAKKIQEREAERTR